MKFSKTALSKFSNYNIENWKEAIFFRKEINEIDLNVFLEVNKEKVDFTGASNYIL